MRDEYDFTRAKRGAVLTRKKVKQADFTRKLIKAVIGLPRALITWMGTKRGW
jgi:hypothetical protein